MRVKTHKLKSKRWQGDPLKIAILSDLHMGDPYVTLERLKGIVEKTNAIESDIIVILGDLIAGHHFLTNQVKVADTAKVLSGLIAPQGVYAITGNHDWWDDLNAQRNRKGPILSQIELEKNGIPVLENRAIKITRDGGDYWLAGLGDQLALNDGGGRFTGVDDLEGTLAQMNDDAPKILLAHEPDIFPKVPQDIALTLSGHTHGGQVRFFGYSPLVPSRFRNRYAYGHVREEGHDIVISGGIGCSIAPIRFGVPPEITVVELS